MSVDTGQSGLLLDGALPDYEARQFTAVVVDAPPERTYQAVRALDPDQVAQSFPPMRMLGRLRALPARLSHARPVAGTLGPEEASDAFTVLAEQPGVEYVVGMVGRFMTARQLEFRRIEPGQFAGFTDVGYGKVALNFRVQPYGESRSLLSTETRTVTTDPVSRAQFRRYWRLIGPFAGLIMRRWLQLAKLRAERPPGPEPSAG